MHMTPTTTWQLASHPVSIAHLEKLYWPGDAGDGGEGVTKGAMLRYYRSIRSMAPVLLPYLQDRLVTLRLFPDGTLGCSSHRRESPQKRAGLVAQRQLPPADVRTAHPALRD